MDDSAAMTGRSPDHVPVLLDEVVGYLAPVAGTRVLDCTCGLGGHSRALLECGAQVLGVDRDPDARQRVRDLLAPYGESFAVRGGSFATATDELRAEGQVFDAILADLGVSSMQLDQDQRGFSIRSSVAADMRMGDECGQDAVDYIAQTDNDELADCLRTFGEERRARRVAQALKDSVAAGRSSGADLADAIRAAIPGHHKRHPAIRCFQAIRMAVNDEIGQLRRLLDNLPALLAAGGRAVIISFHSLEDRLVKRTFRRLVSEAQLAETNRKVVVASAAECERNRRSKPARLRWIRQFTEAERAALPPPPPPLPH